MAETRASVLVRAGPQHAGLQLHPGPSWTLGVRLCTAVYNLRMSTMSVSEARAALPEILDRVIAGEEITITRHGREVAVLVRPDAIRVRRADQALAEAERLRMLLDRGRNASLADAPSVSVERAEELVANVTASRSTR